MTHSCDLQSITVKDEEKTEQRLYCMQHHLKFKLASARARTHTHTHTHTHTRARAGLYRRIYTNVCVHNLCIQSVL
jgi:hypothetical protein